MSCESRQVSEWIDRPVGEVYEFVAEPANIALWAPGLGSSVEQVDDHWFVETPMGRVELVFAERNEYGVLDHHVVLPSGETFYNPMRVTIAEAGSEVVFSVRRQAGMSDEEFARDAGNVAADLARLKRLLEERS